MTNAKPRRGRPPKAFVPGRHIDALLAERGATHGDYTDHARITQRLKSVMHEELSWYAKLTPTQRESLDMIAHKIGRILAGDPNHRDHWLDCAGYAQLVVQRL